MINTECQHNSMTISQEKIITPDIVFPPSDLYSNEPPLETELHLWQIIYLLQSLKYYWKEKTDYYAIGNLTIYYSPYQRKSEDFRGPDFFVVLGTEQKPRKSWVVWEEMGKYPNVIVEVLSSTTATTDKNLKKEIYQDTFRTPNYFWFDPYSLELVGFHLVDGLYEPILPNAQGHLWSQQLELYLGVYKEVLRFFTIEGELVPILEEKTEQAEQRAEQAEQRAQEEAFKAQKAQEITARLAAKLRELNIDPDSL
jgi:Uma2 family endonuclease